LSPDDLRAALRDLNLTRAEFADLCGVERETVYRWLREPGTKGALPVPGYVETIIEQQRRIDALKDEIADLADERRRW
jgi:transcriptional regulator with XRE-family HTH domain